MLDNDTTSSRVAASSSVQSNELVDITNGDAERKSNAANTEGGRGGIPDRGNEKPALSKPGQKEKGEGGRELVPFHSASDIYRTRPTRFLLLLPSLPPQPTIDPSAAADVIDSSSRISRKLRAPLFHRRPRKEHFPYTLALEWQV